MKLDLGSETKTRKREFQGISYNWWGNRTINSPTQSSAIQRYPWIRLNSEIEQKVQLETAALEVFVWKRDNGSKPKFISKC